MQKKPTAPAHGGSKALTGKACTKSDAWCARCTKGGAKSSTNAATTTCTACATSGPVPPELIDGRCFCPAGTALAGSANTVAAAKVSSSSSSTTSPAHGGKGGKKKGASSPRGCAPCAFNAYAATAQLVSKSKCLVCPPGTTTYFERMETCFARPGSYYDPAKKEGFACPVDSYCPGGDFTGQGREVDACPKGSTTEGTTGNSDESACAAPAGSYYDPIKGEVFKCPVGSYCPGGSVDDGGLAIETCPDGTTTAAPGASERAQCTVAPGSYWDGKSVQECPAGFYCPGGSIETAAAQLPCGDGLTSNPGASEQNQCFPIPPPPPVCVEGTACGANAKCDAAAKCVCTPGYYAISTAPVNCAECGANFYCPGKTANPSDRFACPLGKDTAGVKTASSEGQCVVSTCDPCGGSASPTTYFTTGSSKSVYVAASLNPTTVTIATPDASLICVMPTTGDEFSDDNSAINDVAATSTGKLLIAGRPKSSNDNGFVLLLDPAAQTAGQPCVYQKLLDIAPAVAGLGAGPKSNRFYGTGGSSGKAFVATYELSESAGVASLTPVGTADVSATITGAMGASDITAVPGSNTLLRFTSDKSGYSIGLDASGNPIAATVQQTTADSIGLGAPAAWCTSTQPFAGSSSTDNAYTFDNPGRRRMRQLLVVIPPFSNAGETTMPVAGLSGAATLPLCSSGTDQR